MYFFDSTEDDERIYDAADFARFHHQIIGNGVSNTQDLPDLEVSAGDNMEINLGAGYCFANGYMYSNTSTLSLEHDIADTENDRIDRVIIRFDNNPEERTIKARILKGTPDNNPTPPEIKRDNYIHDMSVAQVLIKAGKSYIEEEEITDERANDEVCGYIPLHNIYRGINVDENGMTSFVNQSFVKSINTDIQTFESGAEFQNPNELELGDIIEDTQKEVSGEKIKVKSNGVYNFWVQIYLIDPPRSRFYVYMYLNGEHNITLGMQEIEGDNRRIFFNIFDYLKKGDEIHFGVTHSGSVDLKCERSRIRMAKVS